jgi:Nucleotidyl transferase AbiEii toxin, Type IV TA system
MPRRVSRTVRHSSARGWHHIFGRNGTCREDKEDRQYEGVRIKFLAHIQNVRIPIQVDVGFGDAVKPTLIDYPTLLPLPAPRIQAYPMNSVIAEKLEAIVSLGMLNSRMKGFFDIWFLARTFPFAAGALGDAIRSTFGRRTTRLDADSLDVLTQIHGCLIDKSALLRFTIIVPADSGQFPSRC